MTKSLKWMLFMVACGGLLIATGCPGDESCSIEGSTLTREEIAEAVSSAMDTSVDPCQDFYRYACGNWIDNTPLPGDETRWSRSFSVIAKRNREVLRGILENSDVDPATEKAKLNRFFSACMDEAVVEAAGTQPLQPMLDEIAGVVDGASMLRIVGRMHAAEIQPLFGMFVDADFKDPARNIMHFFQGGLGLPDRDYYFDEDKQENLQAYELHIANMLGLLGRAEEEAAAMAGQILAFETELARISRTASEMRDIEKLYNKVDVSGLQASTPTLAWDSYFEGIGYPQLTELNVATPEFFTRIESLVKETTPEGLQHYLTWQYLTALANQLPQAFVEENFNFYSKQLAGQDEIQPRWRRCVNGTDGALGELLGQAYVDLQFPGDSKKIALDMIHEIEGAFEAGLPELSWMDDTTRALSVGKMQALIHKIGYPDKWRDYSTLTVEDGDYFGNVVRAQEFEFKRVTDKAEKPVDKNEWGMTPSTVNAYYNPLYNEIVFPAGILQDPFFHHNFPPAMNFGGIGMVMGHELTHGFDDMGSKFDSTGKMERWWSEEITNNFNERTACIDELYATYEVQPGAFINGKLTLGENIADLGGLKETYRAFKNYEAKHGADEPLLEGLTGDQLLFVAFAQTWCQNATDEITKQLLTIDPHSPARFRVIGPVAHLPEFAETFSCEAGTPMNPIEKCEVW